MHRHTTTAYTTLAWRREVIITVTILKAKFHYAIQVAVADLQRAGIWPMTHYLARSLAAS